MAVVLPVRRLQEQVKGLKAEVRRLQRDLDAALTSIDNLMREIADSRIQIAELQDELLEEIAQRSKPTEEEKDMQADNTIYIADAEIDEFASKPLDPNED